MPRILVTGATGFIGRHLLPVLDQYSLRVAGRTAPAFVIPGRRPEFECIDLANPHTGLEKLLIGVDYIVHLAGVAHRKASEDEYRSHNVTATARLATLAAACGVKRFVLVSSVKVHGESTTMSDGVRGMFNEQCPLVPVDPYSISKLAAERSLVTACTGNMMEYVILRPPLVYGPGVGANFLTLLKAVAWRLPMPFGAVNNLRSLIYVENLCDIIRMVIEHTGAGNQVFVLKDHDDSTPGLIGRLAQKFGHAPRLFNMNPSLLVLTATMTGMQGVMARLTGSLLADNTKIVTKLGWTAKVDTDTGIARTVEWFVNDRH